MSNTHQFDVEKWHKMTIFAQMGNIGSEVGRAANAYNNNDASFQAATKRALDLFDATVTGLVSIKSPRTKEVLLARESFTSQYFSDEPAVDPSLEQYFMQFAIADRLQR